MSKFRVKMWEFILHERAVRFAPQNSVGKKKLDGDLNSCKIPIGLTNNQWGMDALTE